MNVDTKVVGVEEVSEVTLPKVELLRSPGVEDEAQDISKVLMVSKNSFQVALAQIKSDPGCIAKNKVYIKETILRAKAGGAEVVVFPETTITGYLCQDLFFDRNFIAQNLKALQEIAESVEGITAIVGYIGIDQNQIAPGGKPRLYNAAAVLADGKIISHIEKSLLPTYDIFDERRYFEAGRTKGCVEVRGRKLGIGICEDMWAKGYDQSVYEPLLREKPDLLVNISASPFSHGKLDRRISQIEEILGQSNCPFVYSNLVGGYDGYDGEVIFDGQSLAFGSNGKLAKVGASFTEDLVFIDVAQPGTLPMPKNLGVQQLYDALVLGIRDYFRRCGSKKAFLGLSGGIDSSVVAGLLAEALGPENVICVTMRSHITADETKNDAIEQAKRLGTVCYERPIIDEYNAWLNGYRSSKAGSEPPSLTKQNKQARIRGSILMEYSNDTPGGIVVSTGNKTELALGYCTLYGDMCGGFAAISDVSKEKVYELARYMNERSGREVIPISIINRAPTAELEVGQTDAANLPADYDILSPLVDEIVDEQKSFEELCKTYDPEVVKKTMRLVQINEFKRRQAAPGIRVTDKAFGIGRRVPIAHGFREWEG